MPPPPDRAVWPAGAALYSQLDCNGGGEEERTEEARDRDGVEWRRRRRLQKGFCARRWVALLPARWSVVRRLWGPPYMTSAVGGGRGVP